MTVQEQCDQINLENGRLQNKLLEAQIRKEDALTEQIVTETAVRKKFNDII